MQQLKITIETSRKVIVTQNRWIGSADKTDQIPVETPPNEKNSAAASSVASTEWAPTRQLTKAGFEGLLSVLAPDRDEAGIKYEMIRQKLIRFLERRGCASPEDLTDETINRVASKITQGTRIWAKEPLSYFYGVAWNVFIDHRRRLARTAVPLDGVEESLCFENPCEVQKCQRTRQESEQLLEALDACLEDLPPQWRDLILEYYGTDNRSKIESRRRQAEHLGIPSNALRIRACRIRTRLKERLVAWRERSA